MNTPVIKYFEEQILEIEEESTNWYDHNTGLWNNEKGEPVIDELIVDKENAAFQTFKTATREGIDQTEGSDHNFSTMLTKTRESIDQTESVSFSRLATMITETREAIDRSETSR